MKWPSDSVLSAAKENGVEVTCKPIYVYFDKNGNRTCATRIGACSYIVEIEDCGPEIYSEDAMVELVSLL